MGEEKQTMKNYDFAEAQLKLIPDGVKLLELKAKIKESVTKHYIENECLIPDDNYHAFMTGFECGWGFMLVLLENKIYDLKST